jgi:hypothetical protein
LRRLQQQQLQQQQQQQRSWFTLLLLATWSVRSELEGSDAVTEQNYTRQRQRYAQANRPVVECEWFIRR